MGHRQLLGSEAFVGEDSTALIVLLVGVFEPVFLGVDFSELLLVLVVVFAGAFKAVVLALCEVACLRLLDGGAVSRNS